MTSAMNLQGDLPILYILLAILILLALLAAIGAWVRGGGLKREDAENLFSDAQSKHREEVLRLETALEQTRKESAEALARSQSEMATRMRELNEQLTRSRSELETAVSQASKRQGEVLSEELQGVSRMITEVERRTGTSLENMNASMQGLQSQVKLAGDAVTRTLTEMARQQRDQKAQSTIQLCEALITSLGTLKSTISNQITHGENVVNAEREEEHPEVCPPPAWQSPFEDAENEPAESKADQEEQHIAFSDSDADTHTEFGQTDETDGDAAEFDADTGDACEGATQEPADFSDTADTNHDSDEDEAESETQRYDHNRSGF